MNEQIEQALKQDKTIDITTRGRKSGEARRKEIWFHRVNGRIYISGLPGKRDWYANLVAHPHFTFHLKESVTADLPATATPITDAAERRQIITAINNNLDRDIDLEAWVTNSPLVEVTFDQ